MIKKLRDRWKKTGKVQAYDYFYYVPWWLRIKRFIK